MNCYYCGSGLSEQTYCTKCGKDVLLYKKIIHTSNMYYNEGLERAKVRDLTGAITSLRQSLKLNKYNMKARNLLGLVYFEIGEVAAALSEWVISKNFEPSKNVADDYINRVQNNGGKLDAINQTVKKFNQALVYCIQDSKDLAVIQLKKVLSLNPKFVQAHQLLALLYLEGEKLDLAKRELSKCKQIDINNTLTLRYLQILEQKLKLEDAKTNKDEKSGTKKRGESFRYEIDNEVIIQPMTQVKKKASASSVINIFIGVIIGVAIMFFLVLPGAVSTEKNNAQTEIVKLGNELDVKTGEIQELNNSISALEEERDNYVAQLDGYIGKDGTLQTIDGLLVATVDFMNQSVPIDDTAAALLEIQNAVTLDTASESFVQLYNTLFGSIAPTLATQYYDAGYKLYRTEDYTEAIEQFQWAYYYDELHEDALYNMANAYRELEQNEEAIATYNKLIELVGEDSYTGKRAVKYIEDLS